MAKTFAGKALSGGINKVADSIMSPIGRLKEINRALKKSLKVGTITEEELRRLLEEGEKIQLTLRKVPIDEMDTVIKTTKNVVKGVKVGKDVAETTMVGVSGPLKPQLMISEQSDKLITDVEDTLESTKSQVNKVKTEYAGLNSEMIEMAELADAHRQAKLLKDREFSVEIEQRWLANESEGTTDLFYMGDRTEAYSNQIRDYVHADPRRYAKVLSDAKKRGPKVLEAIRGSQAENWLLNTRVEIEIKMNWKLVDWILDYRDWYDLKVEVNKRSEKINRQNNPLSESEKEALRKENRIDWKTMDELKLKLKGLKADYNKNVADLQQLGFQEDPNPDKLDPTGRITGNEYTLVLTDRQKQLLDESVGVIALQEVHIRTATVTNVTEWKKGSHSAAHGSAHTGETGITDTFTHDSRQEFKTQGGKSNTVYWFTDEEKDGEARSEFIVQNRYGTFVLDQSYIGKEGSSMGIEAVAERPESQKNQGPFASLVEWTQNALGG
jgi:hypothetical protein